MCGVFYVIKLILYVYGNLLTSCGYSGIINIMNNAFLRGNNMNKIWKILVISGVTLILSAILLCVYNLHESNKAFEKSQTALSGLKALIPDIPEKPEETYADYLKKIEENSKRNVFEEFEESHPTDTEPEMPSVQLDGRYYCGYLTLDSLGLELPVLNNWSYANLNVAPCRYEGTPQTHNFIIAAHNYNSHFGQIKYLSEGDEIIFTDCLGEKYHYTVTYTEYIDGYSVEQMSENKNSSWDMTLFTCTLNGQSRVTVRAKLAE